MEINSLSAKLRELFDLLKSGALSQEEYDTLKAKLLNSNISDTPEVNLAQDSTDNFQPNQNVEKGKNSSGQDELTATNKPKKGLSKKKKTLGVVLFLMLCFATLVILQITGIIGSNNKTNDLPKKTTRDLDSICKDIHNSYECAQAIEKYQLPFYKDYVKRQDISLILKLDNGQTKTINNKNIDTDSIVAYCFRDYLENINAYLLEIQYYEGGNYLLIDKTFNKSSVILGIPVVSNDKKRFVVSNLDLESGYTANGFLIYNIDKENGYTKEYEEYPKDWGPSKIKWINDNEIEIEQSKLDSNSNLVKFDTYKLKFDKQWNKK